MRLRCMLYRWRVPASFAPLLQWTRRWLRPPTLAFGYLAFLLSFSFLPLVLLFLPSLAFAQGEYRIIFAVGSGSTLHGGDGLLRCWAQRVTVFGGSRYPSCYFIIGLGISCSRRVQFVLLLRAAALPLYTVADLEDHVALALLRSCPGIH